MSQLFLFTLFVLVGLAFPAMMGGWQQVKNPSKDEGVLGAAQFGAGVLFPNLHPTIKIISAETQVVAGVSYNIKVAITRRKGVGAPRGVLAKESKCTVVQLKVWDQAWRTPRYVLSSNVTVSSTCPK